MVTIYDRVFTRADLSGKDLVEKLLIPPQIINRQGWLKGFFQNVDNVGLSPTDCAAMKFWIDPNTDIVHEVDWGNGKVKPLDLRPSSAFGFLSTGNHLTVEDDVASALLRRC